MAVRRLPLAVFAPREPATTAFAEIWAEFQTGLQDDVGESEQPATPRRMLHAVKSLIAHLEPEREAAQDPTLGLTPDEARGHGIAGVAISPEGDLRLLRPTSVSFIASTPSVVI